jgi:hypothetical protein
VFPFFIAFLCVARSASLAFYTSQFATLCRANQAIWRLMGPTIRQTLLWICCPIGEVYHGEHFLIQAKTNKAEITNKSVTAKWWLEVLSRCSNDQFRRTSRWFYFQVYVRSPHFEADPHNDGHDHEAFLVTTRPVRAGEELMWSYSVAQSHPEPNLPTNDEEAEVSPRKVTTKQTPPPKLPASAAPKSKTKQTPPQKLPATGGNASAARGSSSPKKRCQGCLCVNPCSNPRYCLTPQQNLTKRVSVSKQLSE